MASSKLQKLTIQVEVGDREKLKSVAEKLGYTQDRGKEKGQGSISALMQALAAGVFVLEKKGEDNARSNND